MAEKTATALDKSLRESYFQTIIKTLTDAGEQILQTGGNAMAFPVVDEAGNDKWIEIVVKVPRGEKIEGGYAGYDGYEVAENYRLEQEEKADTAKKRKADAKAKKGTKSAKSTKQKIEETEDEESLVITNLGAGYPDVEALPHELKV